MHPRYVTLGGFRHRLYSATSDPRVGPAVVALHGFGVTGRSFRFVSDLFLQHGLSLHAPDLLGFGESDKPDQGYSLRGYARLTAALADGLDLHRPVLMGHSFGGKLAAATAALYPDRFSGLILVDSGGFSPYEPLLRLGDTPLLNLLRIRWLADRLLPLTPFGRTMAAPESREALFRFKGSHRHLDLGRSGLRSRLPALPLPILVLWGANDRVLPRSTPGRIRRLLPQARLVFFPDAGHVPMRDQPERFVEAVAAFIRTDVEWLQPNPRTPPRNDSDG